MNKYRILKKGDTDSYIVQKRFLRIFWLDRMGAVIPLSLKEAREYIEMFKADDKYSKALRAPNTVIE